MPITLEKTNLYSIPHVSGDILKVGQGSGGSFKPDLTMGCFRGKGSLKFLPQLSGAFSPEIQGDSIIIDHSTFRLEVKGTPVLVSKNDTDFTFNEFGGVDYIFTLKKKPPSNKISFGYDPSVLVPYLQPELTAQEIADGAFRPDFVVNSIAWYHGTQGGLVTPSQVADRITTGKAFHQYRLRLVAADSSWIWTDWGLEAGNLVTLYVDQTFLNTKPYPMMLMPVADTFGDTSTSATTASVEGFLNGQIFACPAAGTGVTTHAYVRATTANKLMKGGLYDAVDPNSNLITNGGTGQNTVVANGAHWEAFAFSSAPTLAAANYRIIVWGASGSGTGVVYYDTGVGTIEYKSQDYGSYPTNVDWAQLTSRTFSLYCTYTPSGGGLVKIMDAEGIGLTEGEVRRGYGRYFAPNTLGIAEGQVRRGYGTYFSPNTLGLTESIIRRGASARFAPDNMGITEAAISRWYSIRQMTEVLGISEGLINRLRSIRLLDESLAITEAFTRRGRTNQEASETVGLTESMLKQAWLVKVFGEVIGLTESMLRASWLVNLMAETVGLGEGLLRRAKSTRFISETLNIAEGAVRYNFILKISSEIIDIAESLLKASWLVKISSEVIGLTESMLKQAWLVKIMAETMSITERLRRATLVRLAGGGPAGNRQLFISQSERAAPGDHRRPEKGESSRPGPEENNRPEEQEHER